MVDASTDEIEITPEMIRAGVEACSLWSACDLDEWKAIDIYRQMERARRATAASKKTKQPTLMIDALKLPLRPRSA